MSDTRGSFRVAINIYNPDQCYYSFGIPAIYCVKQAERYFAYPSHAFALCDEHARQYGVADPVHDPNCKEITREEFLVFRIMAS